MHAARRATTARWPPSMRTLLFSIAVVACSGAYMGLTTRAPQQLTLAAPLSQRTAPAVAVFSTKKRKVARPPVRQVRLLIYRPVRRGPVSTPRSILPYPALSAPTSPHTCRAASAPAAPLLLRRPRSISTCHSLKNGQSYCRSTCCSSKHCLTFGTTTFSRLMCLTFPTSCTFAGRYLYFASIIFRRNRGAVHRAAMAQCQRAHGTRGHAIWDGDLANP